MSNPVDHFRIGLKVHSFECTPGAITEAFGILPYAVIQKGRQMGSIIAKRSSWFGLYQNGIGSEAFGGALEGLLEFIEVHREFINKLTSSGSEIVVQITQSVALQEGIIFKMVLEPFLLHALGLSQIGLQVQAFSAEEFAANTATEPELV